MEESRIVIALRNSLRMNQREFASYLGVSPSVISNVESGLRGISRSLQGLLTEKLNVAPSFLLTGEGPMFLNEPSPPAVLAAAAPSRHGSLRELREVLEGKLVPFLSQLVSAGPGEELEPYDEAAGLICLPEGEARGDLRALRVRGDSMEPTLRPGDIVVCDLGGWRGDGLYVLRDNESAYVKRVRRVREGLEVMSDNPAYSSWSCPLEELVVVGRVCYSVIRL